ncbi:putative glycosyltransferase [Nymphaea thermarum]|nr:putative glycosyltransferase [Nymphaea thermarum]
MVVIIVIDLVTDRSYIEMEKTLKIWIYREGGSLEGHFIQEMDKQRLPFITSDREQALLYFLPFSVQNEKAGVVDLHRMWAVIRDYIQVIANKYPYWNSTNGADHFMVTCHDWSLLLHPLFEAIVKSTFVAHIN